MTSSMPDNSYPDIIEARIWGATKRLRDPPPSIVQLHAVGPTGRFHESLSEGVETGAGQSTVGASPPAFLSQRSYTRKHKKHGKPDEHRNPLTRNTPLGPYPSF